MSSNGLEAVYLANRAKLSRFIAARGAGDAVEDVLQDLWIKISAQPAGPIGNPLSYLYRAADTLLIDRHRSQRQARQRDSDWSDVHDRGPADSAPAEGERMVAARQEAGRAAGVLASLGARCETVFRRARIDGVSQRQIAVELGVSLSTVESDLRIACQALAELKERLR